MTHKQYFKIYEPNNLMNVKYCNNIETSLKLINLEIFIYLDIRVIIINKK